MTGRAHPPSMWNQLRATAFAAAVTLALACGLASTELVPPAPVPRQAPPSVSSAERAMDTVVALARAPRPPGSEEHARAREWIVEAFRAHGLEPEVQEDVVLRDASRNAEVRRHLHAMRVRNVVARLEGAPRPASEASEGAPASRPKAVALFAHYDSVPTGSGAADDAAGVAVLLETLRALKASPPLPRDVLFVVTDGEEVGLMGARAFVERHDAAKDVGVALNFEARGHRGPSLMFQTSPENGGLIRTYAEAVARPVANSAGAEVYRRMPNDTDLTVLLDAGLPGMNFGFVGGVSHYHTVLDTPERLDRGSLQQHGDAALAMTRALAAEDLDDPSFTRSPHRAYVSVFGRWVWHHPAGLTWLALAAGLLVLAFGVRLGFARGRLSRRGIALGVRVPLVSVPVAAALALALQAVFGALPRPMGSGSAQVLHDGAAAFPGVLLLVLSAHSLVLLKIRPDSKVDGLWGGALLVHAALGVVATVLFPGAGVVFAWPLLFGAAGFTLLLLRRDRRRVGALGFVVAAVAVLPVLAISVPLIGLLAEVVTLHGAFLVAAVTALHLSLLAPLLLFLTTIRKWALTVVSGLLGMAWLVRAVLAGGPSAERPEWDSLAYSTDGATASWVSFDREVDAWTALYLGEAPKRERREDLFPGSTTKVLAAPAPALPLPAAELTPLSARVEGATRVLRLRCRVPLGTAEFRLDVPREHHVRLVALDGRPTAESLAAEEPPADDADDAAARGLVLRYTAPPSTFELELELRSRSPVPVSTRVTSFGLPEIGVPRLDGFAPRPNLPDRTMVRGRAEL